MKTEHYQVVDVEEYPDPGQTEPGLIYWDQEIQGAVLECPCGCRAWMMLRLSGVRTKENPIWTLTQEKDGPTLTPSIGTVRGCNSHFSITQGRVVWHR